jgi:hypothetical protein
MPSCSRPSRTLRAAKAVARRRAILDRRCARQHVAAAGRDGRMVPIEQKDETAPQISAKITHTISRRGILYMVARSYAVAKLSKQIGPIPHQLHSLGPILRAVAETARVVFILFAERGFHHITMKLCELRMVLADALNVTCGTKASRLIDARRSLRSRSGRALNDGVRR